MSTCRGQDRYRADYGDLPAIDLNWHEPFGAISAWPITDVAVDGHAVVLAGQRGSAHLTWPARHGCTYAQLTINERSRERLYVGLSRARDELVVCGDPTPIGQIAGADDLRRLTGNKPSAPVDNRAGGPDELV